MCVFTGRWCKSGRNGRRDIAGQPLLSTNFLRSLDLLLLYAPFGSKQRCEQRYGMPNINEFSQRSESAHNAHREQLIASWKAHLPQIVDAGLALSGPEDCADSDFGGI